MSFSFRAQHQSPEVLHCSTTRVQACKRRLSRLTIEWVGIGVQQANTHFHGSLYPEELNHAMEYWVHLVQQQSISSEIHPLSYPFKPHIDPKSSILSLLPFIESNGLIRVGGRIKHSKLTYDQRLPHFLLRNFLLVGLLIQHEHKKNFHAGPQLVLSIIQDRYWIVRGRDSVKTLVQSKYCFLLSRNVLCVQNAELLHFINAWVICCSTE